ASRPILYSSPATCRLAHARMTTLTAQRLHSLALRSALAASAVTQHPPSRVQIGAGVQPLHRHGANGTENAFGGRRPAPAIGPQSFPAAKSHRIVILSGGEGG